jgi:hypothetical protein
MDVPKMSERLEFIHVRGTAPRIIRRHSVFNDLLGESELSDDAKENFLVLKEILASGGCTVDVSLHLSRTTGGHPSTQDQANKEQDSDPDEMFHVLALDLATIFPALPTAEASGGEFIGQQLCLCRAPDGSDENNNWYSLALEKYFNIGIGGSLLSFPEIRQNFRTWWVLSNPDIEQLSTVEVEATPLTHNVIWKQKFDPKKGAIERESSRQLFTERFNQYGTEVFNALSRIQPAADTSATVIVWVYVGPTARPSEQVPRNRTSWGTSLFAVIKPVSFDKTSPSHWLHDPRLRSGLLKAVDKLYLFAATDAYKTLEYRRLMDRAFEILKSAGFVFGHDLKNRLEELKYEEARYNLRGLKQDLRDLLNRVEGLEGQGPPYSVESDDLRESLKNISLAPLDLADNCLGKLAAFSATPELFRVMAKFVSGELPHEWGQKELVDGWPNNFRPAAHLAKAAEACDTIVRQVVAPYVHGLEFELRRIDGEKVTVVPVIDNVGQLRIELPPLSNSPSIAPPYAILAGLTELVRNAVKAATAQSKRGDIKSRYGKLHLDYSITLDEVREQISVSIWNPFGGKESPVSETIGYMVKMYEQLRAVEITPVRTGNSHPLMPDLKYGQSDFIFRPNKVRFEKKD